MPRFDVLEGTEMPMESAVLALETIDGVARISLRNPPVNALDPRVLEALDAALDAIASDAEARAVVLRSDCPGFFSAGDDITQLREMDAAILDLLPRVHQVLDKLEALPLPTIAAINGHALGGGLEVAMACDLRFMGEGSGRIGLPEVRIGMIPSFGGTQRLPALIGKARALELMYKGLQLEPEEAAQIGLVNAVHPQPDLEAQVQDYAVRLARQATGAIASIKRCVNTGIYEGLERGLAEERKACAENFATPDAREGIVAFLEGRKPRFQG
ncbi:MAG: enoyl-CoA hydratase/isomerase family protein [bacterium]|nr:enoyl-CoA hydratase/isomerase family protein [bacterium]